MAKVFTDKISAQAHIESIVSAVDVKDGQFVALGVLGSDGETRIATKSKGAADADVLVVNKPLDYGYIDFDAVADVNKAGKAARAYHLVKGDVLSFSKDAVVGAKVGDKVTVGDGGYGFKLAGEADVAVGLVIGEDYLGYDGDVFVIAITK